MKICLTEMLLDLRVIIPRNPRHLIIAAIIHFFLYASTEFLIERKGYHNFIWIIYGIAVNLWLVCLYTYHFIWRKNDERREMRIWVLVYIFIYFVLTFKHSNLYYTLFMLLILVTFYNLADKKFTILGQSRKI